MWWVLTSQRTFPSYDSLLVTANTNLPDLLYMRWHYYEPARHQIIREVRGVPVECGYNYIWDTPHIVRQIEDGDTLKHTWHLTGLIPGETVWFYLYAPGGPYNLQIQGPLTSVPLVILAPWVTNMYVATESKGVFFTDTFVATKKSPLGTPSWTPVNKGLDLSHNCLGFTSDPYDPNGQQYFLTTHTLYRLTTDYWQPILTRQGMIDYTGCLDTPYSRFPHNCLAVNTNVHDWVALIFAGEHDLNGGTVHRLYFCLSHTRGYAWHIFVAEDGTLDLPYPAGLTVGNFQGSSPYPAGRVIYFMARKGIEAYCLRSIDGGFTWEAFLIGPAVYRSTFYWDEGEIQVDPTSQDKCFFTGCFDPATGWLLKRSADHAETWPNYDDNADQRIGNRACYFSLSNNLYNNLRVGTFINRDSFYKTDDDGASWSKVLPQNASRHLCPYTLPELPHNLYVLASFSDNYAKPDVIWASEGDSHTMYPKSGAHPLLPDGGGDSIPWTFGQGIRGIIPVLTP